MEFLTGVVEGDNYKVSRRSEIPGRTDEKSATMCSHKSYSYTKYVPKIRGSPDHQVGSPSNPKTGQCIGHGPTAAHRDSNSTTSVVRKARSSQQPN